MLLESIVVGFWHLYKYLKSKKSNHLHVRFSWKILNKCILYEYDKNININNNFNVYLSDVYFYYKICFS